MVLKIRYLLRSRFAYSTCVSVVTGFVLYDFVSWALIELLYRRLGVEERNGNSRATVDCQNLWRDGLQKPTHDIRK